MAVDGWVVSPRMGPDWTGPVLDLHAYKDNSVVCVCYQLYYPAIYRPDWIMTAAGFTSFLKEKPGSRPRLALLRSNPRRPAVIVGLPYLLLPKPQLGGVSRLSTAHSGIALYLPPNLCLSYGPWGGINDKWPTMTIQPRSAHTHSPPNNRRVGRKAC